MPRAWYPSPLARGWIDARYFARLVATSASRRLKACLETKENALAALVSAAVAVFGLSQIVRVAPTGLGAGNWYFGVAAVLSTAMGIRAWWGHLSSRIEDSPWVVLGGHPGALTLRLVVAQVVTSALLVGWPVLRAAGSNSTSGETLLGALTWWSTALVVWLCGCLFIGALLLRANRRRARWSARDAIVSVGCLAAAVILIALRTTRTGDRGWLAAGALGLLQSQLP